MNPLSAAAPGSDAGKPPASGPSAAGSRIGLLGPAWRAVFRGLRTRHRWLLPVLALGGVLLLAIIHFASWRFLLHVTKVPFVGPLLMGKLLEMLLMALVMMLLFSSVIASFSIFFLDDELGLLFSTPVSVHRVFWSRFARIGFESSWMSLVFFLPVFFAFVRLMRGDIISYVLVAVVVLVYLILPNLVGACLSLMLARFFPIRQMRKVFQFLGMVVLVGIVFFFRAMEPEKLLNPGQFERISGYILSLDAPFLSWFPSTWAKDGIIALAQGNHWLAADALSPLLGVVLAVALLVGWLGRRHYLPAWQSSLEAVDNQVRGLELLRSLLLVPLRWCSRDFRVIADKEITTVLRDPAMFSQMFMMGAILAVYYYNLRILPLKELSSLFPGATIQEEIYMWNNGFVGFILAALAMRFVFPSLSLEGRAFWATRVAPIRPSRLLWVKFTLYLVPMTVIGFALFYLGKEAFGVTSGFLVGVSALNTVLMSLVITALAIGLGAIHARFDSDNPLKIAGSVGGLVFMLLAGIFVILMMACEIYPLWRFFVFRYHDHVSGMAQRLLLTSSVMLLVLTGIWVMFPLWLGSEAIDRYEPG